MKQTNRDKFLTMLAACILALLPALVSSCSENEGEGPFRVSGVILPSSIDVTLGEAVRIDVSGTPPAVGDEVLLVSSSGEQFSFAVTAADERGFSFVIDDPEFVSGTYTMYIRRGADGTKVGSTAVNVIYGIEITPDEGVTVYGVVTASNKPVPGVVISDGHEVTVTDQDGVYQLRSEKERGYVFMSVPGGYEALSDGVLPRFHATLTENAGTPEREDFYLSQAPNSEFTLIVMGDMHLADRRTATDDRQQFRRFAEDLNEYLSQNSGEKIYALTLGDMTWDYYWTECQYSFPEYLEDMNSLFSGLQVYHTIGNHDHSMEFAGDWAKINQYITNIGPNWYSFNIGECHFVVLDDIDFRDDISDRDDYVEDVSDEQLEWLKKDLQYVDKESTVIVATHAPVYSDKSLNPSIRLGSTSDLFACLAYTPYAQRRPPQRQGPLRAQRRGSLRRLVVVLQGVWNTHLDRRGPGRVLHIRVYWKRNEVEVQGHRLLRLIPVPQLRPEQHPHHSRQIPPQRRRITQGLLHDIRQRIPREQGKRGPHKRLELGPVMDSGGLRERNPSGSDPSNGLRPVAHHSVYRQAARQERNRNIPDKPQQPLLQGNGIIPGHRPPDHRHRPLRPCLLRNHGKAENIRHRHLPEGVTDVTNPGMTLTMNKSIWKKKTIYQSDLYSGPVYFPA